MIEHGYPWERAPADTKNLPSSILKQNHQEALDLQVDIRISYRITSIWTISMKENRAASFILVHQTRILEMGNKSNLSLNPSIGKRCHLFTIELLPLLSIECLQNKWASILYAFSTISNRITHCNWTNTYEQVIQNTTNTKYSPINHKSNLMKWYYLPGINHIDERISHIAFVLLIYESFKKNYE